MYRLFLLQLSVFPVEYCPSEPSEGSVCVHDVLVVGAARKQSDPHVLKAVSDTIK